MTMPKHATRRTLRASLCLSLSAGAYLGFIALLVIIA